MEFHDVVMRRRAVRRFEDAVAGFSQGQRLVVVTDPARRREVARICGEDEYEAEFGPWISECAAQFIPCVLAAVDRLTDRAQSTGRSLGCIPSTASSPVADARPDPSGATCPILAAPPIVAFHTNTIDRPSGANAG